ncbi:aminoacyl-tRNA hydrolase [Synechococcus sp. CS-1324]|uniref:alternative ribosome rescue aminoacyl-tRNA hydrolase ArfB n=1 Tax=unclassified Synechococcus TaxID=2626047 RepID=UPI0021A519F2|nr:MULTISPECIES: alternative ribosome rescue aminoacyl-tRNA hydrolase ArfB [unclassified Synechococcus]MCT0212409.1 aminoacyl-tRNA hydrolase [Synechococcus sp. CS-1326]MCT0229358.1 aminoacyl-tRNA hydrolase [Synechococcus sp. CS-1324]MCT0234592.1 aminoacyl-tRNA hydrolase [Synechococcus sp. CS-1327]
MAADLAITAALTIPATELGWRFSRAGGPGGQGVNTTDSRVELVFPLATSPSLPPLLRERALRRLGGTLVDGAVVIVAAEHRSQWLNRQAALRRLKALLAEAIAPPPPPRRPTRPTGGSVQRRLAAKRRRAQAKQQRRDQGSPDD